MSLPSELVCPQCLGALAPVGGRHPLPAARCERCDRDYAADLGFLDFIGTPESGLDAGNASIGARLMHSRLLAAVYERLWRPTFIAFASGGPPDYAEELALVEAALRPAAGAPVVDLSCGPGFTGRRLAAGGSFSRVYGVDWSVAMLQRAVAAQHRPDVTAPLALVRADVVRLPFAGASIAGVHAGAALHLWPDPPAAIAEAARVLRPGGAFVASTFAHPRGAPRLFGGAVHFASGARVFEADELAGHCQAHGLEQFTAHRRGALILFSALRA